MSNELPRKPWRYTRVGSVLLSYDFFLGVPLGLLAALPAGLSSDTRKNMPGMLIGVAGLGVAIATLVLASLTLLLTTMSAEYRTYLERVPRGVDTLATPYRFVVGLAAASSVFALIAASALPLLTGRWVADSLDLLAFLACAIPLGCVAWSVLGCVQVTSLLIYHWKQSQRAVQIEDRRQRAIDRSAG